MRVIKRAFINIVHHAGKVVLLFSVILIAMALIISGRAISQAAARAAEQAKSSLNAEVLISHNLSQLADQSKIPADGPPAVITNEYVERIKRSVHVKDVIIEQTAQINTAYKLSKPENDPATNPNYKFSGDTTITNQLSTISRNNLGKFAHSTDKLVEGKYPFDSNAARPIIISKQLASDNNLKVGDTLKIKAGIKNDTPLDYTIVGIFTSYEDKKPNNNTPDIQLAFQLENNHLYTSVDGIQPIMALMSEATKRPTEYDKVKVILSNPDNITAFIKEAKEASKDSTWLSFSSSLDTYEKATDAIRKTAGISNVMIIISAIAAFVIVGLIIMLQLRSRKYEIGVLLSLGENKVAIGSQILLEVLLVAIVGCVAALPAADLIANNASTSLLKRQLSSDNRRPNYPEVLPRELQGVQLDNSSGGETSAPSQQSHSNQAVEQIDEISVDVYRADDLTTTYSIGAGVIILAALLPTIATMQSNPRNIMLREE